MSEWYYSQGTWSCPTSCKILFKAKQTKVFFDYVLDVGCYEMQKCNWTQVLSFFLFLLWICAYLTGQPLPKSGCLSLLRGGEGLQWDTGAFLVCTLMSCDVQASGSEMNSKIVNLKLCKWNFYFENIETSVFRWLLSFTLQLLVTWDVRQISLNNLYNIIQEQSHDNRVSQDVFFPPLCSVEICLIKQGNEVILLIVFIWASPVINYESWLNKCAVVSCDCYNFFPL